MEDIAGTSPPKSNYDRLGSAFGRRDWVHDTTLFAAAESYICQLPDGIWLDLGCGTGAFAAMARRSAVKFIGLDVSAAMATWAAESGRLSLVVQADGHALPFKKACLDAVLCRNVLKHVRSSDKVLQEARRVLRVDGGRILVVESCALDEVDRAFMNRLIEITEPEQQPYKTPVEMADQLTTAGFELLDQLVVGHTVGTSRVERVQQYNMSDRDLRRHWNHLKDAPAEVRQLKNIVLRPDDSLSFTLFWAILIAQPAAS